MLFEAQELRKTTNFLSTKNRKKYFRFKSSIKYLNDELIKNIISFYNSVEKKGIKLPIVLELGKVKVADKLSYIVLECLVYKMLETGYSVTLKFNPGTTIDTKGINMSPLMLLNEWYSKFINDKNARESEYKKLFKSLRHGTIKYRGLISPEDNSFLSKLTSNLIFFLKNQFEFRESYRKVQYDDIMVVKLANTVGELVGNAIEHGGGDCLLDIDITHNFTHSENHDKKFGAVNIAIVNFSKNNFGDKVKEKILSSDLSQNQRYQQIKTAYSVHKSNFNNIYTEEHFWNIASVQDKISGRPNNYNNGGKGCTDLIKSIQNFTHEDYCYMMSGKEIINFKKEFLGTDKDGFLGFNHGTFLRKMPESVTLGKSKVYLPGVAYNLNFILEEVNK